MGGIRWSRGRQWLRSPVRVLLLISAFCFLGSLGFLSDWLAYERRLVAAGEFWRPLTAWIAQLSKSHWLVNQVGLVMLALLLPDRWRRQDTLAFIWVWLSASLWLVLGPYTRYAGLSGLLYGWLVWALWQSPHYDRLLRFAVAVILIIKVVGENVAGPYSGGVSKLSVFIGGDIAVQSHLAGLLAGLAAVSVAWCAGIARNRQ